MKPTRDYSTAFLVDQTPQEAFAAITNVRGWWSGEIAGATDKLGAEFTYRYKDFHYSKQRVTEFVPDARVVWLVVDSRLNFIDVKNEWTGTRILFEIEKQGDQTQVRFTHVGLLPEHECYRDCSNAWGSLIRGSLRKLIASGQEQSLVLAAPGSSSEDTNP